MPFSLNSNGVKGKALDVQLYISQCAVLAHNLLYAAEPKPGGASFNYELADTKTMDFLAGGSSLFAPIFGLSKRGILVAENHLWFEDAELGLYILKALQRAITWYKSETNTIFGTILMFSPITLGVAHCFTNEGLKTNVRLNLDNVMNVTEQFLKNSTTDDCTYLTEALTKFVSNRILPSNKVEDDFNSFLEVYQHERTNLYEFTQFYEERDVIFHELAHKYQLTIKYGYSTFIKVYEETSNFKKSIIQTYITLLAEKKDTHIAKRFGNEVATTINKKAKLIIKQGGIYTVQGKQKINELDSYLRTSHSRVINPGSTADLTATTIFLALLQGYRP